jgi:hypothetical protein
VEPTAAPDARPPAAAAYWGQVLAATLPFAGRTAFIVRQPGGNGGNGGNGDARGDSVAGDPATTRRAATIAADVAAAVDPSSLRGPAQDLARATVEAAVQAIDRLANEGWRAVLGEEPAGSARGRLGADAVVERSEAFDPFA